MNLMEELYHGGPVRVLKRKRLKLAGSSVRAVLLIMDIDGFPFFLSSEIDCHAGLAGGGWGVGVHLCWHAPTLDLSRTILHQANLFIFIFILFYFFGFKLWSWTLHHLDWTFLKLAIIIDMLARASSADHHLLWLDAIGMVYSISWLDVYKLSKYCQTFCLLVRKRVSTSLLCHKPQGKLAR